MTLAMRVYSVALRALRSVSPLLAFGDSKLARGIRGRKDSWVRLRDWGNRERDPARPLVWCHAPSVGEGLQARVVLEALSESHPELQVVFTFFSPSAESMSRTVPAQTAGYLPWDVRAEVVPVLEALRPTAVVFTKTEVWPTLVQEASGRGIPAALIAGTLPPGAGRLRWPARRLLRPSFADLRLVAAIADEDARRFVRLGASPEHIIVSGDPGIDSAWIRARSARSDAPYLRPFLKESRPTLVAGSTWEADEDVLLPALGMLREWLPEGLVVIAPHEPTEAHLTRLESSFRGMGMSTERLSRVEASGLPEQAEVVLVDRVGILAHLYTVGSAAFVGGGFHRFGLHSVLEPAAARLPVAFGPAHANARAAGELIAQGGGRAVRSSEELAAVLSSWLLEKEGKEVGRKAYRYIDGHRGSAARTAALVASLLQSQDTG
jgi:3-deoxy-D-manno-octulosonic-acid transferase